MSKLTSKAVFKLLAGAFVLIFFVRCASTPSMEEHAAGRRQTLLEMYPVQKTQSKDIATRFGHPPQVKQTRPTGGWTELQDLWVRKYVMETETRTGKPVHEVERYFGSAGVFSLCYCWFYYDGAGRLLDADWQWSSD